MRLNVKMASLTSCLGENLVCFSFKGAEALEAIEKYKGKEVSLDIATKRKKRSLDSNAYFWTLCGRIAEAVGTDKDSVYLDMLSKYGKFTHIIVRPEAVERMCQEWRASRILGEVLVNGQRGIQVQCFYGSSTYDQSEMNHLILGVVEECRELDIETMTPSEIQEMNKRWCV